MQMNAQQSSRVARMSQMAVFGLKKAFVTPARKPVQMNRRMAGFFAPGVTASGQWLPE